MEYVIESGHDYPEEIIELFNEYTAFLCINDAMVRDYLDLQKFDDEIRDLTVKYGEPYGRLHIVHAENKPIGCIALKRFDETACELKRLYVRQAYRKQGIAERLCRLIISDAREIGYRSILLDTLPFLKEAITLYRRLGFYEIDQYCESPMVGSLYMKYDL